ncbi:MAG: hypothetical protein K2X27_18315, partial [Candidatus Obscuribacterales bacterium]|nr:hypothetical protein [Candidatus Obscuribacterales bacterium]
MTDSQDTLQLMLKSLKTLPVIAGQHYKIVKKGAGVIPLTFTLIQLRILYLLQMLLEKRGQANMVIVKPRQIMSTTVFNAQEFHFSQNVEGIKTLILTHRAKVTNEIFANLKRFQDKMPPELRLETTQNNDDKLSWKNDSEIAVGTAGTDSARGFPCLDLHLSELGRCKDRHVKDIQEGAMNAHASAEPGAIMKAESTSGGEGNYFHEIAVSGYKKPDAHWFTAFFGWWEMPEYKMTPPKGWTPDSEEVKVMKAIQAEIDKRGGTIPPISLEQMYWRHVKLHDHMRGNVTGFQREYPATFEEAFSSAEGKLIDSVVLTNAIHSQTQIDKSQPLILGVDPAGKGDRTALVYRQGYVMARCEVFNKMDDVRLANIILDRFHSLGIDHVFIDMGYGHGTYHILRGLGITITGVHFGSTPNDKRLYFNKRAEMAGLFQDWAEEGPDSVGGTARIVDHPELLR